jgi:Tfp pilus assembly protein PilN
MLLASKNFLGLAIGERSIRIAEIAMIRGQAQLLRVAEFDLSSDGNGAVRPLESDETAKALSRFLRQHRFSASRAVVGLPARWLLARERDVPPASPAQANDILRLQAERVFSAELKDLIFDYVGQPDPASARKVLLLALPRQQLDRITRLAEGAGLSVEAVLPSILALADGLKDESANLLLSLAPDAVEFSIRSGTATRILRHLPVRAPDPASQNGTRGSAVSALAAEVRRAVALAPTTGAASGQLHLWDAVGLTPEETQTLSQSAGVAISIQPDLSPIGLVVAPSLQTPTADLARYAPAAALALTAARLAGRLQAAPVDFLRPRLAPPRKRRISRAAVWTIILSAAVVLALGSLVYDVQRAQGQLDQLQAEKESMKDEVAGAKALDDRVRSARGWFDNRSPMLEALRELTMVFREDERIYVTSFTLRDNRKGQINGRASDERFIRALLDRLKENKKFADVKLLEMRDAGGNTREVTFGIGFTYTSLENVLKVLP